MKADEFINKILSEHGDKAVEILIDLSGGGESDWLEFKADIQPMDGKYENGENSWDYRWNFAEAVIALANTSGGAVLLGVAEGEESGNPEPADIFRKRNTAKKKDAFFRDLKSSLAPNGGWKTGKSGHWKHEQGMSLESLNRIVKKERMKFRGKEIVVIIVPPIPEDEEPIMLRGKPGDQIPVRELGALGKIDRISDFWEINRFLKRDRKPKDFQGLYIESRKLLDPKFREINEKIKDFLRIGLREFRKRNDGYFPLDAKGFSPRVDSENGDWEEEVRREPEERDILSLMEKHSFLVLFGKEGSGKTSVLRQRWAELAESCKIGEEVPVFISLSDYREGEGLEKLISKQTGLEPIQCAKLRKDRRFALFLDGWNECPEESKKTCLGEIQRLLEGKALAGLLVSSRGGADTVEKLTALPGVSGFELLPVEAGRRRRFFETLHGNASGSNLLCLAGRHDHDDGFLANPRMAAMLAEVVLETGGEPVDDVDLFRRFIDMKCETGCRVARAKDGDFPWDAGRLGAELQRIALEMTFKDHARTVPMESLNRSGIFPESWFGDGGPLRILSDCGIGLFRAEDDWFRFDNLSIQQFLAAAQLARDTESQDRLRRADAPDRKLLKEIKKLTKRMGS